MNDVTSVPARIVVIGTSKKKLAERFKDLSPERKNSRRASPSSRRSSRPPPEPKANFLHDDYMDNELFDRHRSKRPPPRDEYLSGVSEEEDEVVNIPAHVPRRQRQIVNMVYNGTSSIDRRPRNSFGGYSYNDEEPPLRPRFPPRRRFIFVDRRRFRPMKFIPLPKRLPVSIPLEERISILRKHNQMPFIRRGGYRPSGPPFSRMRTNLKRLQHFVPRDRFSGRRDRRGGLGRRQYNSDNPRLQMTTTELDNELDQYMKSSKHPRVTLQ
uniref:Chromatin target of PRMT1 protein C-terminal domain-containing protein n=1 Tax=Acrobeloides nanus TaxID=290746 RepID=A0A914EIZ2_9BILA